MKIDGLIEIIVYCESMAQQVAFYTDVLGLEVTYPADCDDYSDQHWVTFQTGACTLALHSGGERRFGTDAPKFVFGTDDVDACRVHLEERDVSVGEFREPAPGIRLFEARDPEGNVFTVEQQG